MTEQEWLECTDPMPMLEFLRGKASDRKLRLFAVACCRRIWNLLTDEKSRKAVDVAELYADGLVEKDSLIRAVRAVPMSEWPGSGPEIFNWRLVTGAIAADMTNIRTYVWLTGEPNVPDLTQQLVASKWAQDGACFVPAQTQAALLRDIFGNPFRPVTIDQSWLTPKVKALAQAIYDDRAFERLPSLADQLEKAGCDNDEILGHCREPGAHVRGCWVVDLVLGKG
jgi:hypothetical protein